METYFILKDGLCIGSFPTKEEAIEMIRMKQKRETHPFLKANFSIIVGKEEVIPYAK